MKKYGSLDKTDQLGKMYTVHLFYKNYLFIYI